MTVIDVAGLRYRYPDSDRLALDGVDLSVDEGEFVGVVGANSAGKTTLLRALVGLVPHFYRGAVGGQVAVAGIDVHASSVAEVAQRVGFVFANPATQISGAKPTVFEELAFGLENAGVPRAAMIDRIDEVVDRIGLAGLETRNPFTLSGGELQRVALASVLVLRPVVLVLDEPTSQLDPSATRGTFSLISGLRDEGMTVVVAEHDVDWLAASADRLLALDGGQVIAAGAARDLYRSQDLDTRGVPVPTATQVARALGWRDADGAYPVTLDEACRSAREHHRA